MNKPNLIKMKINEAIDAGKNKEGKTIKIPIFEKIELIDGELYGTIERYTDSPGYPLDNDKNFLN
jgi:hypothetical protein